MLEYGPVRLSKSIIMACGSEEGPMISTSSDSRNARAKARTNSAELKGDLVGDSDLKRDQSAAVSGLARDDTRLDVVTRIED